MSLNSYSLQAVTQASFLKDFFLEKTSDIKVSLERLNSVLDSAIIKDQLPRIAEVVKKAFADYDRAAVRDADAINFEQHPFRQLQKPAVALLKLLDKTDAEREQNDSLATLCEQFENWYWPLVYSTQACCADDDDYCEKLAETDEGKLLFGAVSGLGNQVDEIAQAIKISTLEPFLQDMADLSKADIRAISIGCSGRVDQQVYPCLIELAKAQPERRIQIDLFDTFTYDSKEGYPEAITKAAGEWEELEKLSYRHRKLPNLMVKVHRIYFPTEIRNAVEKRFSSSLLGLIQKQLAAGQRVIISQHTGDNYLGAGLQALLAELKDCPKHSFYLMAQSGIFPSGYSLSPEGPKQEFASLKDWKI